MKEKGRKKGEHRDGVRPSLIALFVFEESVTRCMACNPRARGKGVLTKSRKKRKITGEKNGRYWRGRGLSTLSGRHL